MACDKMVTMYGFHSCWSTVCVMVQLDFAMGEAANKETNQKFKKVEPTVL